MKIIKQLLIVFLYLDCCWVALDVPNSLVAASWTDAVHRISSGVPHVQYVLLSNSWVLTKSFHLTGQTVSCWLADWDVIVNWCKPWLIHRPCCQTEVRKVDIYVVLQTRSNRFYVHNATSSGNCEYWVQEEQPIQQWALLSVLSLGHSLSVVQTWKQW